MAASQLYATSYGIMAAAECDFIWQRSGNAIGGGAPMNTYRTSDDHWLCLFAPFEKQWQALCAVIGKPELASDPRCKDWDARVQNAEFVDLEVAAWVATQTAAQAEATLEAADIVAAPVMDFGEIVNFPHYQARDMIVKAEHAVHGPITHYGVATKHSRTPGGVRRAAPLLGEHNAEILGGELGLGEADLADLKSRKII